jgi:hypothetical protein
MAEIVLHQTEISQACAEYAMRHYNLPAGDYTVITNYKAHALGPNPEPKVTIRPTRADELATMTTTTAPAAKD